MSKISYSAWSKYMTCPKLYDYHYNERLRPSRSTSALKFGSAIDEALNHLLLTDKDPLPVFQKAFEWDDLQDIEWDKRDLDWDLFDEDQLEKVKKSTREYASWACMRIKGRVILESYQQKVYPFIEEVESVQKELSDRSGFLDVVCKLKAVGRVLLDHKTVSRPYDDDAPVLDPQLALYAASEGIDRAGFIVMHKSINKNLKKTCKVCGFDGSFTRHKTCPKVDNGVRCRGNWIKSIQPEANIQIMFSEIPKINKDLIEASISQVETLVEQKVFPRNLTTCRWMYGKRCPYIKKCWTNKEDGLEYKDKKETK